MKKRLAAVVVLLALLASGCSELPLSTRMPRESAAGVGYNLSVSGSATDKMAVLVVLVEFTDVKLSTDEAVWARKFFGPDASLAHYYGEMSGGKLTVAPAAETFGAADGVVRVRLDAPHPRKTLSGEKPAQEFVKKVLEAAGPYVDFSAYDRNGDGVLWPTEFTPALVVAGYEKDFERIGRPAASTGAHMAFTDDRRHAPWLDGVFVEAYQMSGELVYDMYYNKDVPNTLEIIAHETGHMLGLPDLYDTDGSTLGVGMHSAMGGCIYQDRYGRINELPVELDAWSRLYLGFSAPQVVTQEGEYPLEDGPLGNVLLIPTQDPDQYFLVENRQFTGYDAALGQYIAHGGVCVWHVNDAVIRAAAMDIDGFESIETVNDDEKHKGVDLEEANQEALGYAQLDAPDYKFEADYEHYFSAAGISVFDASELDSGEETGIAVRVLSDGPAARVRVTPCTARISLK
jgi:M6 family metalloprotease-like protein